MELGDTELLANIKGGCKESLNSLLSRHFNTMYRFAFRLCGCQDEAEEITQEAMIKAARGIRSFQARSEVSTWLYRITANTAHDLRRKRERNKEKKRRFLQEGKVHVNGNNHSKLVELELLEILCPKERDALVLTILEELTHKQVAKILGCAETTVSWRVHKAKKKLRAHLRRAGNE